MDMKTLRETAREKMKGFCKLCPVCDGKACTGQIPGMGGPVTSASFKANVQSLADARINMRTVHDVYETDCSFDFFGEKLSTPIMNGPIGAVAYNCGPYDTYRFQTELMQGMTNVGSLGWIGDPCDDADYESACRALRDAGKGIVISKPHLDPALVRERFREAQEAGAIGFGMDIDGAGIPGLRERGYPMGPKSVAELRELRKFAPEAPFIIKGIMTPDDALRCAEAGVNCIVVSNHGGRVLDGCPGVAEVLPGIKRAVGNEVMLLADGGVRSGVDVLKMIALGADAVLIGRPACWGVYGGGIAGVEFMVNTYTAQLKQAMLLTGCATLKDIDWRVLHRK